VTEDRYAVVIEDDADTRELVNMVLTQSGFTVVTAVEGLAGIEAVRTYNPLLTTLDVQMPGMDGFAVAKRLREFSLTYLIMLTSMAGEIDVISGFEAGADDYLVKPFRPRELRARADAMLRRPRFAPVLSAPPATTPAPPEPESWATALTRELRENPLAPSPGLAEQPPAAAVPAPPAPAPEPAPAAPTPITPAASAPPATPRHVLPEPAVTAGSSVASVTGILQYAGLALDSESGRTTYQGRSLELTPEEFDLLNTLLHTGRRVRSKADLVLALRGHVTSHFVNEADKRRVDALITSLRGKLGDDDSQPKVIETVRGVGYRLAQAS
jgi:two-component system OmpR family response regulator